MAKRNSLVAYVINKQRNCCFNGNLSFCAILFYARKISFVYTLRPLCGRIAFHETYDKVRVLDENSLDDDKFIVSSPLANGFVFI